MFQAYMFPANEYEYSFQRDSLKEAEDMFAGIFMDLTEVRFESTKTPHFKVTHGNKKVTVHVSRN